MLEARYTAEQIGILKNGREIQIAEEIIPRKLGILFLGQLTDKQKL